MKGMYLGIDLGRNVNIGRLVHQNTNVTLELFESVKFTEECPHIQELSLKNCKHMKLTSLAFLPNLRELSLRNNGVKSMQLYLPSTVENVVVHERNLEVFACSNNACVRSLVMHVTVLKGVEFLSKFHLLQNLHLCWSSWGVDMVDLVHPHLSTVNIIGARLHHVGALPNVQEMNLQLVNVPTGWSKATSMTKLVLYFREFGSFRFIGSLVNLTHLELASIPPYLSGRANLTGLQFLPRVKTLILKDLDNFKQPPAGEWCHSLECITITDCTLDAVPPFVLGAVNVVELFLNDNAIDTISPEIQQLQKIRTLNLAANELHGFPLYVTALTTLEELDLSGEEYDVWVSPLWGASTDMRCMQSILEIPPEIRNLHKLRVLTMSDTDLVTVSAELYKLQELQTLKLNNTEIEELPVGISNMASLKRLVVNKTRLTCLPQDLFNCPKIQIVEADDTYLTCLPHNVHHAKTLHMLAVNDTNIRDLPVSIGDSRSSFGLEGLAINKLPLSVIHACSFHIDTLRNTVLQDLEKRQESTYWTHGVRAEFPESTRTFQAFIMLCAGKHRNHLPDEIWMHVFSFMRIRDYVTGTMIQ